jgi:hypothetical protein
MQEHRVQRPWNLRGRAGMDGFRLALHLNMVTDRLMMADRTNGRFLGEPHRGHRDARSQRDPQNESRPHQSLHIVVTAVAALASLIETVDRRAIFSTTLIDLRVDHGVPTRFACDTVRIQRHMHSCAAPQVFRLFRN